jgi:hypothetical protein
MLFGRICSRSNRKVNSSGTIRPGSLVIACDKREAFAYGSKVRRNPFSLCGDMDCFVARAPRNDALKSVILRCARWRASKDDGPAVAASSFEARYARTSSDNGSAVARG